MIDKSILNNIPKGTKKSYFLIDVGAFIIPYLKYNVYTFNRTNITPFIKLLETYFHLTAHARDYRFFFFIDNGVPEKIESMYSAYKKNRAHSRHRREDKVVSRDILKTNEYVTNRTLITQFFTFLGEGVFYYNEADYQLGYTLKNMIEQYGIDGTQCYVLSHDKDLMALIGHCNCIRKLINSREKSTKFWYFPKGDYAAYLESDEHVYSYEEFIIRKALLGDKGDNILAPIMVKESYVKRLFTDYKFKYGYIELDMEKTFEIIKETLINKTIKKKDTSTTREAIEQRLAMEFRRNYLIFDVYNSDQLFKPVDKKFMDVVLQNVINNCLKRNYQGALDLLKRVSGGHAEIFVKWFTDMKKWHGNRT
jgi:hypothetical protein